MLIELCKKAKLEPLDEVVIQHTSCFRNSHNGIDLRIEIYLTLKISLYGNGSCYNSGYSCGFLPCADAIPRPRRLENSSCSNGKAYRWR